MKEQNSLHLLGLKERWCLQGRPRFQSQGKRLKGRLREDGKALEAFGEGRM